MRWKGDCPPDARPKRGIRCRGMRERSHEHWYWWAGALVLVATVFLILADNHWGQWKAILAYVLLVAAAVFAILGAKGCRFPFTPQSDGEAKKAALLKRLSQPSADRPSALRQLRDYATDKASAHLMLYPTSQQPLADRIESLFQDAGWQTDNSSVAFEQIPGFGYFKGIEVKGHDRDRIEAVAKALTTAGVPMVRASLEVDALASDHPKFQLQRQRVRVTIGHTSDA